MYLTITLSEGKFGRAEMERFLALTHGDINAEYDDDADVVGLWAHVKEASDGT